MKERLEYKWENTKTRAHDYIVPLIIDLIGSLSLPAESRILDAGCGGGELVNVLVNRCGFKNVYGFDISTSGVKSAKKGFPELEGNFFIHDVYESKLPSGIPDEFDLVISMEVIEHLFDPKAYLTNISLWLKQNGYLILTTPYHGYLKNVFIALLNRFDRHFGAIQDVGHIKFFSRNTLYKILENAGIKPLRFCGAGRLPFLWKSMVVVGISD